jgi:hypothetical protein
MKCTRSSSGRDEDRGELSRTAASTKEEKDTREEESRKHYTNCEVIRKTAAILLFY